MKAMEYRTKKEAEKAADAGFFVVAVLVNQIQRYPGARSRCTVAWQVTSADGATLRIDGQVA